MSYLDNTGLAYFYDKINKKYVSKISTQGNNGLDILTPDDNGNITITRVATADNLVSPDV